MAFSNLPPAAPRPHKSGAGVRIEQNVNPAELLPQVYDTLRKLAAAKLANERANHTLEATALVHEAYLRLGGEQSFGSKSAFLRAAAQAMRRVLVDHARAKLADKR